PGLARGAGRGARPNDVAARPGRRQRSRADRRPRADRVADRRRPPRGARQVTRGVPACARRVALAVVVLAVGWGGARSAEAGEPLPPEVRARAETDFVWGRLEALDSALGASTAPV